MAIVGNGEVFVQQGDDLSALAAGVHAVTATVDHLDDVFGCVTETRRRPGFTVEPVSIAWNAVAFEVHGQRTAIVCAPRGTLDDFLVKLDDGRLDGAINAFLASPPRGRVLRSEDQTRKPGLFDELASPAAIAPSERVPGRPPLGL